MESNLLGTFNLFEAARQKNPGARILFISSSDIFGTVVSRRRKLTEESPFRIVSPYAFTKVAGELLSLFYADIEGLDVVIARPFPHTGPGQTADFVCSDWAGQIARIERGEAAPVIKVGNLDVRRDFSDVRDTVRAYVALMKKGRKGEVYNICTGKAVTLGRILSTLIEHARLKKKPDGGKAAISVEVDPAKLRKVDVTLLVGRNRKIRQETGWSPSIPLEKTLADLLADWRSRLKAGA
jgi:GDP-4-dehydro-6-deoxy-D-mannose reductase